MAYFFDIKNLFKYFWKIKQNTQKYISKQKLYSTL